MWMLNRASIQKSHTLTQVRGPPVELLIIGLLASILGKDKMKNMYVAIDEQEREMCPCVSVDLKNRERDKDT